MRTPWTLLGAPLDSSGAGRGEERAPQALRTAGLPRRLAMADAGDVTGVVRDPARDARTGIIAFRQLVEASTALRDAVAATIARGERSFVLGGDCSVLPGALAGARSAHASLSLWMIDGHPDALDGESSPTGEAADMDLAVVVGHGAPALIELAGTVPIVEPHRVALVGHRPAGAGADVAAELALIPPAVRQTMAPEVRVRGAADVAQEIVGADAGRAAWLHLDLDVLDEAEFSAVTYPQPQGLTWTELVTLITPLLAAPGLVGVSLADFDPDHDSADEYAEVIVDELARAWPKEKWPGATG